MRQTRELLHLGFEHGRSQRLIVHSLGVVRSPVERVIQRFGPDMAAGPGVTDAELKRRLYRGPAHDGSTRACVRLRDAEAVKQLACKGVTPRLLWSECHDLHADGIGYRVSCDEPAVYRADRDLSHHVPGRKG